MSDWEDEAEEGIRDFLHDHAPTVDDACCGTFIILCILFGCFAAVFPRQASYIVNVINHLARHVNELMGWSY